MNKAKMGKMGFFGKKLQRGFTLIELAIVVVVGGVILIAVFSQGRNMFDTSNATQDSKDFVLLAKDLAFFYDGRAYTGLNATMAAAFLPDRMVNTGTPPTLRNSGGGVVTVGPGTLVAANDAVTIVSNDLSVRYCIKLVELASRGFARIDVDSTGGTAWAGGNVKAVADDAHRPADTIAQCTSGDNSVRLMSF